MRLTNVVTSPLFAIALAGALVLPACSKKAEEQPAPKRTGGEAPAPAAPAKAAPAAPAKAAAVVGCKLAPRIEANVTLPKGCALELTEAVSVEEGATLTIEPGARLAFGQDLWLHVVNGKLVAQGTPEAPIVFTSSSKTPAPGDWRGIDLGEQTGAGTVLEHVVIEFAGRKSGSRTAALTLADGMQAGRVAVVSTTIRKNDQAGMRLTGEQTRLARFEKNTLAQNPVSLHIRAELLGSVGAGNKFVDPIEIEGNVVTTQTWPAVDAPIVVTENLRVGGEKSAAILTLPEKATLKFPMNTYVEVGVDGGGGLVAKGVTFTSNNTPANPGDWVGLFFNDKTVSSVLDGCTIAFAGRDASSGKGAVTFNGHKPGPALKITNTTFKSTMRAAISGHEGDCGEAAKPAAANKSEGAPLCAKPE